MITENSVFEAVKAAPEFQIGGTQGNGGTATGISGQFGISGTSKAVSDHLKALHSKGKVKALKTYTDRVYYV
jgi:hypothetical protein